MSRSLPWLVLAFATPAPAADLRVGAAAADITPPAGTPMLTPQRPPFAVKLAGKPLDPLHVKAVVLEAGGKKAAIVVCDLTSIPIRLIEEMRRAVGQATDLDPDAVMVSATHTHTAPQIRLRFLGAADEPARRKAEEYVAALPGKVAEAVRGANAALVPVKATAGVGREDSVAFNRRFVMSDGTVLTNPGKDDPDVVRRIVRPAGPTDPSVGVVEFMATDGSPVATLVNFGLHLDTVGGDQPSADFPATIDRVLSSVTGGRGLTVFGLGAAGNVNHYDLLDPDRVRRTKGPGEAARIGTILAAEVLRTRPKLRPVADAPLRVAREVVRLDMPAEKGAAFAKKAGTTGKVFDGELDVTIADGRQTFDAEVQVIAVGDLAWVGFPGEMFCEFGLATKAASPFRFTMIHTLANGSIGYVPDRKAHPQGAYEALYTRCAPGSGEKLVEAATRLLVKLKDDHPAQ